MKSGRNEKEIKEKGHFCTGPVTGFARACYLQRTYVTRILQAKKNRKLFFSLPEKKKQTNARKEQEIIWRYEASRCFDTTSRDRTRESGGGKTDYVSKKKI